MKEDFLEHPILYCAIIVMIIYFSVILAQLEMRIYKLERTKIYFHNQKELLDLNELDLEPGDIIYIKSIGGEMSDIARCPVCRDKDGRCDCQISDFCDRIKQLEDANEELINRDNVDEHNFGAHMMAKQILKSLKHGGEGGFGEPLANEIIQMFKQLEKQKAFLISCIKCGEQLEDDWEKTLEG